MKKYIVLLDISPVEGNELKYKEIPLQDEEGNKMAFKTKSEALKGYKKRDVGYYDKQGKYVRYKFKIIKDIKR